jgi:outer membrane protein
MIWPTDDRFCLSLMSLCETITSPGEPMSAEPKTELPSRLTDISSKLGSLFDSPRLALLLLLTIILFGPTRPLLAQTQESVPVLTLSQAISLALRNQPSISASRYVVRANEARVGEAESPYYPQLSGTGSYSRTQSPTGTGVRAVSSSGTTSGTSTITAARGPTDTYTGSVGLNQMVYDFGKTSTQVRISKLNSESARADLANVEETVVLNVRQAYYNVLQAQRNQEVNKRSVDQFQQHLEQARGFYEVGAKAKFDVTKAEVDLSNAKVNLINAQNQARLTLVTLKNAIGIPNAPEYRLEDNLLYERYELPFDQALDRAYSQRPDLQAAIKRKESSKQSIALARKGYLPVLNANANYLYTGSEFPLQDGWSYGLNLSVPIFSGFLTRYQVSEAEANYGTAAANEQSLRLDIYSQVEQAFLSLRAAGERISAAELGVRQAKENVELATGRYEAGVGGPLEVTDAITAQSNADLAYTSALTDYKNAQAAIEKAIGEKP